MIDYFAYGSNMWQLRLEARVGPVHLRGVALLEGCDLRWHKRSADGSGKCDIQPLPDGRVWGVVYAIPDEQMPQLDKAESVGNGYTRETNVIVRLDGVLTAMQAYRAQPSHIDPSLRPYDWYHALVLAGARQHMLPIEYIAAIERIATVPDPVAERGARERGAMHSR
ncbi:MAG: gamma-glutamylcyclotransferase family protein [Gemmatimonadota bacterium]